MKAVVKNKADWIPEIETLIKDIEYVRVKVYRTKETLKNDLGSEYLEDSEQNLIEAQINLQEALKAFGYEVNLIAKKEVTKP